MSKKLVLFDIDGTLLKVEGISRNALIDALRAVYGTEGSAQTHDFAGKLDSVIINEVMREAGFTHADIAAGLEQAKQAYIAIFKERAKAEHIRLMVGVVELLDALAQRDDVVLALLTGNFEESGRHKLILPNINHYFSFGAFADDAESRNALPPIAVERAYKLTGKKFVGKDVVIVGDTEHDVRCSKVLGSKCVAVATGHYTAARLESYNPDYTFPNFSDTRATIEAIMS
jgi:phosphoglycolate phosphatase-like HAD superfamily hydrolase